MGSIENRKDSISAMSELFVLQSCWSSDMFGYEDKIDCYKTWFEKNQLVNANDITCIKVNGLDMQGPKLHFPGRQYD